MSKKSDKQPQPEIPQETGCYVPVVKLSEASVLRIMSCLYLDFNPKINDPALMVCEDRVMSISFSFNEPIKTIMTIVILKLDDGQLQALAEISEIHIIPFLPGIDCARVDNKYREGILPEEVEERMLEIMADMKDIYDQAVAAGQGMALEDLDIEIESEIAREAQRLDDERQKRADLLIKSLAGEEQEPKN